MIRSTSLIKTSFRQVISQRAYSSNVAVQDIPKKWITLSTAEQNTIAKQLEELQKKNWKELTKEEKAACYYVSFGPHGPRAPIHRKGDAAKILGGVGAVLGISTLLFYWSRIGVQEVPHTMSPEWQAATNEYLKTQNSNPISGISSEDYKGTGYVAIA